MLYPLSISNNAHKISKKRYPAKPTSLKPAYDRDIFFKGGDKSTTKHAIHLMEKGETAGNALIVVLKGAKLQEEVAKALLHGLEGTIPFVNLATKAPGIINNICNARTAQYRQNLKSKMTQFFKYPSSSNLKKWNEAENSMTWAFLTPARDMYDKSVEEFRNASAYILQQQAPTKFDQNDLERGITRKNTALGTMFLFNQNELEGAGSGKCLYEYGHDMLKYKFDLVTTLKIADMYKSEFTKKDLTEFYTALYKFLHTAARPTKEIELYKAKVDEECKNGSIDKRRIEFIINDYYKPLSYENYTYTDSSAKENDTKDEDQQTDWAYEFNHNPVGYGYG